MANPGFPGTNVAYHVGIEFTANSGFIEVRDRVLAATATFQMGSPVDIFGAATAEIRLDNSDGRFSPQGYASNSYHGRMRPGLPIRVWGLYRTDSAYVGGTDVSSCNVNSPPSGITFYPIFTGVVDQWGVSARKPFETTIQCRDETTRTALQKTVNVPIQTNINAGSLLCIVISHAGVSATMSAFGAIEYGFVYDNIPVAYFEPDITLGDALNRIIDSGDYRIWTNGAGKTSIFGRYAIDALTELNYGSELGGAENAVLDLSWGINADQVYNKARVVSDSKEVGTSVVTLGFLSFPLTIQGSKFANFFLDYVEPETFEPCPATSLQTLVSSTDYYCTTDSLGTGIDRTSTLSVSVEFFATTMVATVFNGHSDTVYLNRFQVRGVPLRRRSSIVSEYDDSSSQAVYGVRERTVTNNLIGTQRQADTVAQSLIFQYKNPTGSQHYSVRNLWPGVMDAQVGMNRDIPNTFVGIPNSVSGGFGGAVATRVEHILEGEAGVIQHTVNVDLEQAPATNVLILTTSVLISTIDDNLA